MDLGKKIGLDDEIAGPRINRYENGVMVPDIATATKIAHALGVPLPAMFTDNDRMAEMIARFAKLSAAGKRPPTSPSLSF